MFDYFLQRIFDNFASCSRKLYPNIELVNLILEYEIMEKPKMGPLKKETLIYIYIYIYITIYFKYGYKIKGSVITSSFESLSSSNHIFVHKYYFELKLSAIDRSVCPLSSNMRFCMSIFNGKRSIHLYIVIGGMVEVITGCSHI